MLFRASRASFAGLRVTESGSVAGSGAQPLLDNMNKNHNNKNNDNNNNSPHPQVQGVLDNQHLGF